MNTMQVRFALSSSSVFSRTDTVTDSERFYNSVVDLFEDVEEQEEVNELQTWWNRYVFALISLCYGRLKPGCSVARSSQTIPQLDVLFVKTAPSPG
jgi:hypothetical protein